MEEFYLENTPLYEALVNNFEPRPCPPSGATGTPSMVVSVRIRPFLDQDATAGFPCASYPRTNQAGVLDIHDLYHHPKGRPVLKSYSYQVDNLFGPETTEQEIYNSHMDDLVSLARNGGCGTIFAYGQTGSGKTYTISRLEQLVVESLVEKGASEERQVFLTIIELAGNQAYDLLSDRKPISLLDNAAGVTQLGAEEHVVQGRDEMMDAIERATSFRRTKPTLKNDASSRSHSICRFRILDTQSGTNGFLYLVDLAGSEAARDVAVHGPERMRETREINVSLSVLKDCMRGKAKYDALTSTTSESGTAAKQIKPPYLPFRQSALTRVLKHALDPSVDGSKTRTMVIACVNPGLADVPMTRNTMSYAEMLCGTTPSPVVTTFASSRVISSVNASKRR